MPFVAASGVCSAPPKFGRLVKNSLTACVPSPLPGVFMRSLIALSPLVFALGTSLGCASGDCEAIEAASQACLDEYEATGDTDFTFSGAFECSGHPPKSAEDCALDAFENADCTVGQEVADANDAASACMADAALDIIGL